MVRSIIAASSGDVIGANIGLVLKQKIEPIDFYPIPTRPITELISGPGNAAFDIKTATVYSGNVRLDLSLQAVIGVGAFKTAQTAKLTLSPLAPSGIRSQLNHNVVLKRPYVNTTGFAIPEPPYARYNISEELEKVFRETNVLYWAKALLKLTYDFIDHSIADAGASPPFDIPRLRFVEAGLMLAYSERLNAPKGARQPRAGTVSTAYLVEEVIDCPVDEFTKFIHNSDPNPLPDPGESGYGIAQFLAFTQHVQYMKMVLELWYPD